MNSHEQSFCRFLLDQWARWLCQHHGWNHRSPTDRLVDQVGIGHSGFNTSIPLGVEPNEMARRASLAMQELRERDGRSAQVIEAVYLRARSAKMADVAAGMGMTTPALSARRRRAESAFYGIVLSRMG